MRVLFFFFEISGCYLSICLGICRLRNDRRLGLGKYILGLILIVTFYICRKMEPVIVGRAINCLLLLPLKSRSGAELIVLVL